MNKSTLNLATNIAYSLLEKSKLDFNKISYIKLQCLVYQANKCYYQYNNELLCKINTITSNKHPINIDILQEFVDFRNKPYIKYDTDNKDHINRHKKLKLCFYKAIFLDYIWYKYSNMLDEDLVRYTLGDKVFDHSSGVDITQDAFTQEEVDASVKVFMDFLTK